MEPTASDAGQLVEAPKRSAGREVIMPSRSRKLQKRVLIVDDHPTMREGLIRVIEREADLQVCGEADSAPQAVQMIKSTKPDLVLLDISLGKHNGIELTAEIVSRSPQLMVLMHSMHEDPLYAQRSLRAGARGYVAKSEPPENLLKAIRAVLQGETYLNETIAKQLSATNE